MSRAPAALALLVWLAWLGACSVQWYHCNGVMVHGLTWTGYACIEASVRK